MYCRENNPSGFVTLGSTSMRNYGSLITQSWGILKLKVPLQLNHLHYTLFPFINTFIDLNYKFYYCFSPYIQSSPYFALLYTINYLDDHLRTFYGGAHTHLLPSVSLRPPYASIIIDRIDIMLYAGTTPTYPTSFGMDTSPPVFGW
jgi:hypothetical protein